MVFYEPNTFFNGARPTNLGDIGDPRAALSFHDYVKCPPTEGCADPDPVIANALAHVSRTGDALLITEFGATDDVGTLGRITGQADQAMVGWQQWHYCDCGDPTTSGVDGSQAMVTDPKKSPAGANLRSSTIDVLARPYPQAIAGKPSGWNFDAEKRRFTFGFNPTPGARGITRVAIPGRAFPDGYTARVTGAEVVSPPGAATLLLRSCRPARPVTLKVEAGRDRIKGGCGRARRE
jgi:endoglycosylceramidase